MPDDQQLTESDALASLQALLALIIHHWQQTALEVQAFRRATQGDKNIQAQVVATLTSAPFVDRLRRTDALRNQVLRALAEGRYLDIPELTANLSVLLGQTPEGLEDSL